MSRKRLHVDIVILPLIRNLAFTCKKNVGAVADLLLYVLVRCLLVRCESGLTSGSRLKSRASVVHRLI